MSKMRKNVSAYAGPAGDRNDCAVRALAVAAKMPYKDAYARFERAGRKEGHGTPWPAIRQVLGELGCTELNVQRVPAKFPKHAGHTVWPSIAKWAREHRDGVFILSTSTHMLALVNGVVHDWLRGAGSHGKVRRAWRVK